MESSNFSKLIKTNFLFMDKFRSSSDFNARIHISTLYGCGDRLSICGSAFFEKQIICTDTQSDEKNQGDEVFEFKTEFHGEKVRD